MKFNIGDVVTVRGNWNLFEINMIYGNGEGGYIEIRPFDKINFGIEDLSLHNHEDLELIKKRKLDIVATSFSKDLHSFDDDHFKESLEKKRTLNPFILLRVWFLKRRYKNEMSSM